MTNIVKVWNLGRSSYEQTRRVQAYIAEQHARRIACLKRTELQEMCQVEPDRDYVISNCDTLLLIEHDPVYTAGPRALVSPRERSRLTSLGAEFHRSERGGLVTFHGPGQLTAFPVLDLRHFRSSVRWIISCLQDTVTDTCHHFGLKTSQSPHIGVWIADRKVCAIGVHVSKGVLTHGLGFNCSTDLGWFDHIVPCGISDKAVTSLSRELGRDMSYGDVLPVFMRSFEKFFDCELVQMTDEEKINILKAANS